MFETITMISSDPRATAVRCRNEERLLPLAKTSFTLAFFCVAGQTAWSLRPFVGRPAQADVPLLRAPEGTFLEAVVTGVDSARGRYQDECAHELDCQGSLP